MFDCVSFFNELDLLEIRFNILDDVVEKFVVVESTRTFSGKLKPLYFDENKERFSKFLPKIIHLVHHGFPIDTKGQGHQANWDPMNWTWFNENSQRNTAVNSLNIANTSDGLLLLSDVDEILKPEKLIEGRDLALSTGTPVTFSLAQSMYWMNYAQKDTTAKGPYIFNPYTLAEWHKSVWNTDANDPSSVRWHVVAPNCQDHFHTIHDAGWHFSTLGGLEQIRKKFESFSHHDQFNNEHYKSEEYIIKSMIKGVHLYDTTSYSGKCEVRDLDYLPKYIQDNYEKYQKYII